MLEVDAISVAEKLWFTQIGKLLLSILIAVGSTITVAFSSTIVANIVETDPSKFPYTIAFVGIVFLPIYVWLGLIFMSMSYIAANVILFPFSWMIRDFKSRPVTRYVFRIKDKPAKERYFWILLGTRTVAVRVLIGILQFVGRFDKSYSAFVTRTATAFLVNYEMYIKTHCDKKDSKEKFAYINAKEVLVLTKILKNEHKFSARPCHLMACED